MKQKIDKIEEVVGLRSFPDRVGVDELVELLYEKITAGCTYCVVDKDLTVESRQFLSKYNFEVRVDTYTAGNKSSSKTTISW